MPERLSGKVGFSFFDNGKIKTCFLDEEDHENVFKAICKLNKIENFEQELGVGIIPLYTAIKNGIIIKNGAIQNPFVTRQVFVLHDHNINLLKKRFDIRFDSLKKEPNGYYSGGFFLYFKDIGKTWEPIYFKENKNETNSN